MGNSRDVIIKTAVDAYNSQFDGNKTYDEFDVTVMGVQTFDRSVYIIYSLLDENFRLVLDCQWGNGIQVTPFKVWDDATTPLLQGDYVYRAEATFNKNLFPDPVTGGRWKWPDIVSTETGGNVLLKEDGLFGLLLENGNYIKLESS